MTKTYEIIPSWTAILPMLVQACRSDVFHSRKYAEAELQRMAELADRHAEYIKHAHQLAEDRRIERNGTND